jgi:hypothetical protein
MDIATLLTSSPGSMSVKRIDVDDPSGGKHLPLVMNR